MVIFSDRNGVGVAKIIKGVLVMVHCIVQYSENSQQVSKYIHVACTSEYIIWPCMVEVGNSLFFFLRQSPVGGDWK